MTEKQNQLPAANSLLFAEVPGHKDGHGSEDKKKVIVPTGPDSDNGRDEHRPKSLNDALIKHDHYDTDAADLFLEVLGFGRQEPRACDSQRRWR